MTAVRYEAAALFTVKRVKGPTASCYHLIRRLRQVPHGGDIRYVFKGRFFPPFETPFFRFRDFLDRALEKMRH